MKTAVISGASSGIGLECARAFLNDGYEVYNLSRRPSPDSNIISIKTDVTDEQSVKDAFNIIAGECETIDVVLSNAGFGISGAIEFTDTAEAKRQMDVNFFGTLNVIKASMPHLRKSHGRIIATSSVAAVYPIPFQSFYSASKSSVTMMMSALANEVRRFDVSSCSVLLGDTKTGFTDARARSFDGDDIYGGAISKSVAVMEHDERTGADPVDVAKKIVCIAKKKRVRDRYVIGAKYKLFVFLGKILPSGVINRLIGMIYIPK